MINDGRRKKKESISSVFTLRSNSGEIKDKWSFGSCRLAEYLNRVPNTSDGRKPPSKLKGSKKEEILPSYSSVGRAVSGRRKKERNKARKEKKVCARVSVCGCVCVCVVMGCRRRRRWKCSSKCFFPHVGWLDLSSRKSSEGGRVGRSSSEYYCIHRDRDSSRPAAAVSYLPFVLIAAATRIFARGCWVERVLCQSWVNLQPKTSTNLRKLLSCEFYRTCSSSFYLRHYCSAAVPLWSKAGLVQSSCGLSRSESFLWAFPSFLFVQKIRTTFVETQT